MINKSGLLISDPAPIPKDILDGINEMVAANTGVPKSILEDGLEDDMSHLKLSINYDGKIPINDIPKDLALMTDYKQKMLTCVEMEDEFIFEHLVKYANDELYTPEDNIRISKRLLKRALECFKKEHKEEWDVLTKGEE